MKEHQNAKEQTMKTSFNIIKILFMFIFIWTLSACEIPTDEDPIHVEVVSRLDILFINDLHGAIEDSSSERGMARIGQFLSNQKNAYPEGTLILSAGDMFQGTAVSNLTYGKIVVDIMNVIQFDAMTIGNHEFDWGVDKITVYHDGNSENGEANFPFIACNIYERSTDQPVEWADPYVILSRGGLKIGVIGVIGEGLTSSISPSISNPFEFKNPAPIVSQIASDMRKNHNVDVVIVNAHDGERNDTSKLNSDLSKLSGDSRVDAILNSHTHYRYARTLMRGDGYSIPIVQAGSSGSHIGKIVLTIDPDTKQVLSGTGTTIEVNASLAVKAPIIENMINQEIERIAPIIHRVIGTSGEYMTSSMVADWSADVIRKYAAVDVGIINYGGIRSAAFPIQSNQTITIAKMIEVLPFDNFVKTVTLSGSQLLEVFRIGGTSLAYSANVVVTGSGYSITASIDGDPVMPSQTYTIAAVDYVFDQSKYPFSNGDNPQTTGQLARDYMIAEIELLTEQQQTWKASSGAIHG